jgi:hypothetical protein
MLTRARRCLVIEALVHLLSGPEVRRELFGHGHFLAGTRIATNSRLTSLDGKSPESSEFHAFASRECFSDLFKNCVDDALGVTFIEMRIARRQPLDELRLDHNASSAGFDADRKLSPDKT